MTIPYIAGVSEKIKKHLISFGIGAFFKPINTLRSKLVKIKDKTPWEKRSHLVYGIKCGGAGCHESYVGETQQALRKRMYQHTKPSAKEEQNSAVYNHLKATGHAFDLKDNVTILDSEESWVRRGVKEAIWERVESPSLNRRGGLRHSLSHTWDRALRT